MTSGVLTDDSSSLPSAVERCLVELRAHCQGESFVGVSAPAALSSDFGGMVLRRPALVLRPRCDSDVVIALQSAREHGLPVNVRGAGHSQSGQGLGAGLLLDMTTLDGVSLFVGERPHFEAGAGATWQSVLASTVPRGLIPLALTHALDTTVAGTLSVGGVGGESFRAGAQVDNVEYFDVATVDGVIKRCSAHAEPELFDAVRGGLGQCAVILRVGYPLRACGRHLSTRCFGYRDAQRFVSDVQELAASDSSRLWLAGAIRPDPFVRSRQALLLLAGEETDDTTAPSQLRARADFELPPRACALFVNDGAPPHPFFQVFGGAHDPSLVRPWVEHFFPEADAAGVFAAFLDECQHVVGQGTANVLFVRRAERSAPLLRIPTGQLSFGVGVFSIHSSARRAEVRKIAASYAARMSERGGHRYTSGFFDDTNPAFWARHFGEAWPRLCSAKQHYDPTRALNSGFIDWPETG